MDFNSYFFILIFFPIVCFGYHFANRYSYEIGKLFLTIMSALFYFPAGLRGYIILFASVSINYGISYLIVKKQRRKLFGFGIAVNVSLLLYCKYANFFIDSIENWFNLDIPMRDVLLPLGISFYTFQQIMYLAEIRENKECYPFWDYCLYVLYFPKILMGPLIEPSKFIEQINDATRKRINYNNIVAGVRCFIYGLFKKVIIADAFATAVRWGYSNITSCTSVDIIIVTLSYTLQIYFDFSGYSDMARGMSAMLNIDLPINFDSPYKCISITDFWNRWHISLTKFLTKYIYIPLGGSRKGDRRTYINIMLVFLISGLWHGSNWTFLLWGELYGVFMCIERRFRKPLQRIPRIISWAISFSIVNLMWLLFWTDSLQQTKDVLSRLLYFTGFEISSELEKCFCLKEFYFLSDILKIDFLDAHLWSLSMIIVILGALSICLFANNINNLKEKGKVTYTNLISTAALSIYCILSLGYKAAEFVYKGF